MTQQLAKRLPHSLFALAIALQSLEPLSLSPAAFAREEDASIRAAARQRAPIELDRIGSGELLWKSDRGLVPLPLADIDVDLTVTGMMVRGRVTQTFSNPSQEVIEAVYVFPLPEGAAVDAMEMRIGERRIVAVLREREEAKAVYEGAKREGKKASLLQQERPNLFTSAVAGINPGETVVVTLEYLEEASWQDGSFSLVFPLTFTPRYTPAGSGGAARASGAAEASGVSAGGLPVTPDPHEHLVRRRAEEGATIGSLAPLANIRARIDAGVELESVRSASHAVHVALEGSRASVEPAGGVVAADRDFLLSWTPRRGREPQGGLHVEDREDGRYGLLMLLPPIPDDTGGAGLPTATLFVVDVSGSMQGSSIEQAREALLAALERLRPGDTFNILRFSDTSEPFRASFQPVTEAALEDARTWIRALRADGGTEILPALVRGLEMVSGEGENRAARLVFLTDGAVGNEDQVLAEVSRRLGRARLHALGIGSAPNRYLMRKMAARGRGLCEFIGSADGIGNRIDAFLARLDRPVMADVTLEWDGAPPLEVYPERLPDLYAGEPVFVSVKLGLGHPGTKAALGGRVRGGALRTELAVGEGAPVGSGAATRWARAKVEALIDSLHEGAEPEKVREEVVALARPFNLVTRYTSLVAVEETRTAEGRSATAGVPNALPAGVTGVLPQGGTSGPLLALFGLVFTMAGALLGWASGFGRGPRS